MRVLHFDNRGYFAPISDGADVLANNQLEYFHQRGWEVDCLLTHDPRRDQQAELFRERYPWVRSIRLIDPPLAGCSFREQLSRSFRIARSEVFREVVAERPDLFLTNNVLTAPLLEMLPSGCKRLLAATDSVTDTFVENRQIHQTHRDSMARARDSFLRNLERELYQLFDGVLFLDEPEGRRAGLVHPGRTHYTPPMMSWEIGPEKASGRDPVLDPGGPIDLIFVGGLAPANVRGLTFFYREIFVPYLRKHRVHLTVIGNVSERLDFDDWYVTKLGLVPGDLEEYYARSKVVIIPILDASGLSLKTIEGLARGRPVVTSCAGACGLPPDPEAFLQVDMVADPRGTAETILDLLASEPKRQRLERTAEVYFRMHFGRARYFEAMDRVLSSLEIAA